MVKFQIETDTGTKSCLCPEAWEEVNLGMLIRMEENWSGKKSDMIGLLSALTFQDYSAISNSQRDLWEPLFAVMGFVFTDPPKWNKLKQPKVLRIDGIDCKMPRKIGLTMFGQKVMALQLIGNEELSDIEKIPKILAIYLQPIYDASQANRATGKFNTERLEHIEHHCLYLKAKDAYPAGSFFLNRLLRKKDYGILGLAPFLWIARMKLFKTLPEVKDLKALVTSS